MTNNVVVDCLGLVKMIKVKVCGVQFEVDMYVMTMKGEGYTLFLG